ncbi:MAG TPA: D-alanine--D-alanine ligase [Phycisphaerae bacterium]
MPAASSVAALIDDELIAASKKLTALDITVLHGGAGPEREVSLVSGRAVADALRRRGHHVSLRDITPANISALDIPADCVFIALHGTFGEDGTLQRLLEARGVRYCGSGPSASELAMNKVAAKRRFVEAHVPTPRFDVVKAHRIEHVTAAGGWPLPAVVKPVASGSSVDTFIVRDAAAFDRALKRVIGTYGEALVEDYIRGPELTVGIVGRRVLPACQIRTQREFYDYHAKYVDDDTEYLFDLDLPAELLEQIAEMSLQAFDALGCRDFGRVDWMVDAAAMQPYVLEINTIPGFTSHSLLPKAAARVGLSFDDLCERIVGLAQASEPRGTPRRADARQDLRPRPPKGS